MNTKNGVKLDSRPEDRKSRGIRGQNFDQMDRRPRKHIWCQRNKNQLSVC